MTPAALADRIADRIIEGQARERGQLRAVILAVLHEAELGIAEGLDELEVRKTDPAAPPLDEPFSGEDEHRESER